MKNKVGFLGVFLALALVCSYIESLIPFYFGIPGMKLGLTNIVVLLLLYYRGPKEAILISVMRIVLAGFMFGNVFSIVYSLAGGVLSFLIMWMLKLTKKVHMITLSICGGIFHNLGQIIVAIFILENKYLISYYPFLFIAGAVTGLLIGILANEIWKRTKQIAK